MTWPITDNTSVINIDNTTDSPAAWRSDGHALTQRVQDLIGIRPRTSVKSAAYTVVPNDCGTTFLCDASFAGFTLTLPEASLAGNGFTIIVTKTDAKYKAVTINPYASELINGRDTVDIDVPYGSVQISCNGTAWFVVAMSSALEVWADSYGVYPNLSDVTSPLNAAFSELGVSASGLVRTLRFRTGQYKMNNVAWGATVSIVGENVRNGTWFTYNGANSDPGSCMIDITMPNQNISWARITDLAMYGWDQSSTGQCAEFVIKDSGNSSPDIHFHLSRVAIAQAWGNGIDVTNTRGLVNFHLDRIRFDGCGGYGVAISGSATSESRPFTLSKFTWDNNISSGYEAALIARGKYTTGAPRGKGVLWVKDARGIFAKISDGRLECNKNLVNSVAGKKCLFFLDFELSGNAAHLAIENITGFSKKADAAIVAYDENGLGSFTFNDISVAYAATLYESGKAGEEWKRVPGGFSSKAIGGSSLSGTLSYSIALNGHKLQPMGVYDARPFYNQLFEFFKRGDIIMNSSCELGEPAFYFCTAPTSGHSLNNSAQIFSSLAILTAGSSVINLSADPDAFRYAFVGNNLIIVGAAMDEDNDIFDLVTAITAVDADAKTITVSVAPDVSLNPATIKAQIPNWVEAGQVGFRTFNGNPYGVLAPKFIGERLLDVTSETWHTAVDFGGNKWRADSSSYIDLNAAIVWDPPSLADGATATVSFNVTGAVRSDLIIAGLSSIVAVGWHLSASVIADNLVGVTLTNKTGATANLGPGTLRVRLMRPYGTIKNLYNPVTPPPPDPPPGATWNPLTGTGKLVGTPVNWTTQRQNASGTTTVVTNTTQLNAAMTGAGPGDVIVLSGASGPWTGQWDITASGSAGAPLIIVADLPGTWGSRTIHKTADQIKINGSNILIGGFKFSWVTSAMSNAIVVNGSNVEITDFEMADINYTSSSSRGLVITSTAHDFHLHHCELNNNDGMNIAYDPDGDGGTFAARCIIEFNDFIGSSNKWLQIGQFLNDFPLQTGVLVQYNKITNCESHEIKTSSNRMYRNYVEGSSGVGMSFRTGTLNIIEGNYFKSCVSGINVSDAMNTVVSNVFDACTVGIRVKEGSLLSQMDPSTSSYIHNAIHVRSENTLIAHNTFINSTGRDIYMGVSQDGRAPGDTPQPYSPKNIWIYNNIFSGSAGVRIYFRNPDSANNSGYPTNVDSYHKYVGIEIKNNILYVTGTGVIGDNTADGGTPSGYINWTDATLTTGTVVSGNIESNPNLTGTYRLTTGSPAINAGTPFDKNSWSPSNKSDWDGETRTQGSAPDCGVEEFA